MNVNSKKTIICSERAAATIDYVQYGGPLVRFELSYEELYVKVLFCKPITISKENIKKVHAGKWLFFHSLNIMIEQKSAPKVIALYSLDFKRWIKSFDSVGLRVDNALHLEKQSSINLITTVLLLGGVCFLCVVVELLVGLK